MLGSVRKVTGLGGLPFFDAVGHLRVLAGPTFLHIKALAHSAGLSIQDETIKACACAVGSGKVVTIFFLSYKRS